jgi:hypothetical protein
MGAGASSVLRVQPTTTYTFWKEISYYFLYGTGKYGNRKLHAPARCAGWLQEMFLYAGEFTVRPKGKIDENISKIPLVAPFYRRCAS